MKYRKKIVNQMHVSGAVRVISAIGMLHVVSVRAQIESTGEIVKQRILLVSCAEDDVEKKLRWLYDSHEYKTFSISSIERVTQNVHVLSTSIEQERSPADAIIDRDGRSELVRQTPSFDEPTFKQYAVGIATRLWASDEMHALRKCGALLAKSGLKTSATSHLSEDSTVSVEEIGAASSFARARDVSNEIASATFVRG